MSKVIRYMVADYLQTGESENSLMGAGFATLDENPTATVDTTAYINDKSASGTVTGYQTVFPFDTQFISDEAAIKYIYDIARNQKTGTDAQTKYYRVDVWDNSSATGSAYPAREFTVAIEVSGITGAGTEIMKVAGNLHQVGNFVEGTFDTTTKTFTATGA
jgi:hypothetical protein